MPYSWHPPQHTSIHTHYYCYWKMLSTEHFEYTILAGSFATYWRIHYKSTKYTHKLSCFLLYSRMTSDYTPLTGPFTNFPLVTIHSSKSIRPFHITCCGRPVVKAQVKKYRMRRGTNALCQCFSNCGSWPPNGSWYFSWSSCRLQLSQLSMKATPLDNFWRQALKSPSYLFTLFRLSVRDNKDTSKWVKDIISHIKSRPQCLNYSIIIKYMNKSTKALVWASS